MTSSTQAASPARRCGAPPTPTSTRHWRWSRPRRPCRSSGRRRFPRWSSRAAHPRGDAPGKGKGKQPGKRFTGAGKTTSDAVRIPRGKSVDLGVRVPKPLRKQIRRAAKSAGSTPDVLVAGVLAALARRRRTPLTVPAASEGPGGPVAPEVMAARVQYLVEGLDAASVAPAPLEQFRTWFASAVA